MSRVAITVSVPADTARAYREYAKKKKETVSQLFREMFDSYRRDELKAEFKKIQRYGKKMAKRMKLTEKDIERIVLEGR